MRTSDPSFLVAELRGRGLTLNVESGRLRVAPADRLTNELRASIREHKEALLSLVANKAPQAALGGERYIRTTTTEKTAPAQDMAAQRVTCGQCQHFNRDTINPSQGMGLCTLTKAGLPPSGGTGYRACYPMAQRACHDFVLNTIPVEAEKEGHRD
ncbi:hypothetical protein HFU84_12165 [Acidithiobacillus sp. CV18-2]|nr:hypothetical protein [Acidithiobacillus sp. CV18-3]MBU2756030.1 hypothetical protein [Acidithiobacillus sp. BN09-2]MBU2778241.1 hypothetical protein [Acidithiobacillus sp. CV18-2]MBU2799114.1 hypothetical protein [Acidithiobacillus sp. VAN18-4]